MHGSHPHPPKLKNTEISTLAGNCSHGQVRLAGGNATSGRVEVCINNAWGTVCNSRFGTNEAKVICQQLGFSNIGNMMMFLVVFLLISCPIETRAYRTTNALFGQASGPIFLHNLACVGVESAIFDCPRSVPGLHQCDHSQDAGVQCYGM